MGKDSIVISWLGRLPVHHDSDVPAPGERKLDEIRRFLEPRELELKRMTHNYFVKLFDPTLKPEETWSACTDPSITVRSDGDYCVDFESRFDEDHGLSIFVRDGVLAEVGGQGDFW